MDQLSLKFLSLWKLSVLVRALLFLFFICFYLFQPLPAEEEKELKQTLQHIIGQGKTVTVEQKVISSVFI